MTNKKKFYPTSVRLSEDEKHILDELVHELQEPKSTVMQRALVYLYRRVFKNKKSDFRVL